MTERGDKTNLHTTTQRCLLMCEGEMEEGSGGQEQCIYEGAKAASDATGCKLLFFSLTGIRANQTTPSLIHAGNISKVV